MKNKKEKFVDVVSSILAGIIMLIGGILAVLAWIVGVIASLLPFVASAMIVYVFGHYALHWF